MVEAVFKRLRAYVKESYGHSNAVQELANQWRRLAESGEFRTMSKTQMHQLADEFEKEADIMRSCAKGLELFVDRLAKEFGVKEEART